MARDVCYFDGRCGLCTRSTGVLRALDWLDRLGFQDMNRAGDDLPVPMDVAMTGMPMRTRDGRTLVGYDAVRRALRQTPLGLVPALVLYVPGIDLLGRRVYRWIADNRRRNVSCSIGHDAQTRDTLDEPT